MRIILTTVFCLLFCKMLLAQLNFNDDDLSTKADTLRGTINANRSWYDVTHYNLTVTPNINAQTISGTNTITFKVNRADKVMQLDLQQPLKISTITHQGIKLKYSHSGNVVLVRFANAFTKNTYQSITVQYSGKPRRAVRAPWDGGIVWAKDDKGRDFVNTACQGLGASVWWPCKDHQSDEPDSMLTTYIVPSNLVAVGNGILRSEIKNLKNNTTAYQWAVSNPINTYGVTMNIATYVNFNDTLQGENGVLNMRYWVLDYNLAKAKLQFLQAKKTIRAFEYWFGPYPFYKDDYKLIETHHLGMEHQSAVAYGNKYKNGYLGSDLSGTGIGLQWDYIIVHESGHEWFGNNITTNDIADMWVHEGFTDYSETLYTEYYYGKKAAQLYCIGLQKNIQNDRPIIGPYGVNKEGSGDMYYKGANIINTIRIIINNDSLFRQILRGLNKEFYLKTVTSKQIEEYISISSGVDFSTFFDQYLRSAKLPKMLYYYVNNINGRVLYLKLDNCNDALQFPINVLGKDDKYKKVLLNTKTFVNVVVKDGYDTIADVINTNMYINFSEVYLPNKKEKSMPEKQ